LSTTGSTSGSTGGSTGGSIDVSTAGSGLISI